MPLLEEDLAKPVRQFVTSVQTWLNVEWTVAEALEQLRRRQIPHQVIYFYAVDGAGRLAGVMSSRKLLLCAPETRIGDAMDRPVISLDEDATLAEAMEEFAIRRLLALPVVDREGKLLGVVDVQLYAEEAFDLAEAGRVADLFQLIGLSLESIKRGGVLASFKARIPWLALNIAGGLACAGIAAAFHHVIDEFLLLAFFIPLVLTLSESISMQSMTLTLQYLHGQASWRRFRMRFAMEWKTAALLACACAAVGGAAAMLWPQGLHSFGVIMLSIAVAMAASATLGMTLPAALRGLKLDPHLAAGPVVLMIGDVIATALYLGLATAMLM